MLRQKALQLNEKLGGDPNFNANNFKLRQGIRELEFYGERLSSYSDATEEFERNFAEFLMDEGYASDDVYKADEIGLNWRSLPRKSFESKKEFSTPAFKSSDGMHRCEWNIIIPCHYS